MSENDLTPIERQLAEERLHAMDMQDKARSALSLVGELERNLAQLNLWIAEIVGGKESGNPKTER